MIISSRSIVLLLIASVLENINDNCHALRLISPDVNEIKYLKRISSSTTIMKIQINSDKLKQLQLYVYKNIGKASFSRFK